MTNVKESGGVASLDLLSTLETISSLSLRRQLSTLAHQIRRTICRRIIRRICEDEIISSRGHLLVDLVSSTIWLWDQSSLVTVLPTPLPECAGPAPRVASGSLTSLVALARRKMRGNPHLALASKRCVALYRASQNFSAVVMISSQSRDYCVCDPPGGISKALERAGIVVTSSALRQSTKEQKEQMGGEIDEADEDKD
ncbi:hypothetical protein PROFUN_13090 [Planoprotostelium fungivorum]|uniref:Uncharacterized protein n=1 Tax=Planoprotostelium fungivorum TaxID=1890364 RepID=A0A2P6N5A9_9EUKA|nr:hypothetical protein PROFUN_13090 [Planoprotostelium fungivorum]